MTTEASTGQPEPPKPRHPLTRGWVKAKLIRELAQGEKTQQRLADEYGVTQSRISQFGREHKDRIDQVKADLENEFAGMWIADKKSRLAEYMEDAERLADTEDAEMLRIKHNILKAVADELGQIPSKVNISVGNTQINYVFDGVNLDDLK